jgi:hypothetical protein
VPLGSHNRNIGEVLGAVYRFVLEPPPWSLEESSFDLKTGAQHIMQCRIFAGGHTEERTLTRYHYTLAELIKLCDAAGLTVRDVYGDWQLTPFTLESPRTMLVTRKEA